VAMISRMGRAACFLDA